MKFLAVPKSVVVMGVVVAVSFVIALFAYGYIAQKDKEAHDIVRAENKVLYWGNGCPHCSNVDEYLQEHPIIEETIPLSKKEVYSDRTNALALQQHAKECGMQDLNSIGVPFMYYEGECIAGDTPIIDFLERKAKGG